MWKESVEYLVNDLLRLEGHLGESINFFIYDTIKIWFLLITIIFVVSYLRIHFNTEYIHAHLQGKSQLYGNVLAALFGTSYLFVAVVPFFFF